MPQPFPTSFRLRSTCLAVLLATAPMPASVRPQNPNTGQPPVEAARGDTARVDGTVVTLSFAGGPLSELVQVLRKVEPNANVVLAEAARNARVPAIELRGAGLEQALEAACAAASGDYDIFVKRFRGPGAPVYSLVAAPRAHVVGPGAGDDDALEQRVFSLNELTTERSAVPPLRVETILSAIELATSGNGTEPTLRYHQDSGLLLVRGPRRQIEHALEVLRVLGADRAQAEARLRAAAETGADQQRPRARERLDDKGTQPQPEVKPTRQRDR